jgi:hypothetical protein
MYDVESREALRVVHVSGTLTFSREKNTLLEVGLLRVAPGETCSEDGFDCHDEAPSADGARPALEIGTAEKPIPAGVTATIRLRYFEGMNAETLPAIVACSGRWDVHGAAVPRTWLKLAATASVGSADVKLEQAPTGWKVGDHVIVTGARERDYEEAARKAPRGSFAGATEEAAIVKIDGAAVTLDHPLQHVHFGDGMMRSEVALLSHNVVVESADPAGVRGHTMYHRGSRGSISYAEFRHLGKRGVLAAYPIHFHLAGDSMRGTSVVGASIWDSANRWLTIHGTDYVVVRDVVGYKSVGHGFFLEDGTEVDNVFDRCLAVQALRGAPLPNQALGFDKNDGAGFWWANSLNSFTGNVAAECDQHGYRYEVVKDASFDPVLPVRIEDGGRRAVDVRTLPFIRFDDNEAHSQRRFALNLGGIRAVAGMDDYTKFDNGGTGDVRVELDTERVKRGDVGGVGPDVKHPFVIRNFRAWTSTWAFHGGAPSVLIDGLHVYDSSYGIWRSRTRLNVYKNLSMTNMRVADVFHPWGGNPSIEDDYNKLLRRTDDRPPVTVVTGVVRNSGGELVVRGTCVDDTQIVGVSVNGVAARAVGPNFMEWEAVLSGAGGRAGTVTAVGTDKSGNVERTPHVVRVTDALAAASAAQ